MPRRDQVTFTLPSKERVTITVQVHRPGAVCGCTERARAEEIAGYIWMAMQAEEIRTTPP